MLSSFSFNQRSFSEVIFMVWGDFSVTKEFSNSYLRQSQDLKPPANTFLSFLGGTELRDEYEINFSGTENWESYSSWK